MADGSAGVTGEDGGDGFKDPLRMPSYDEDEDEEVDIVNFSRSPGGESAASTNALAGSFKIEAADVDTKDLFVTVDNREKHAGSFEVYITYRVTTKTTRGCFDNCEFAVRRRFQDFVWLRQKLTDDHPTHFIPPLPEKTNMRLSRFSNEFLDMREKALNSFLNRIAEHPTLSFNENFQIFLTAKELETHRRYAKGLVSRVGSSVKTTAESYRLKNRSPEFTTMADYVDQFGQKIGSVDRISQRIVKEQSEYHTEIAAFAPSFELWSDSETDVADILHSIAMCLEKCANFTRLENVVQQDDFGSVIKEYVLYADAMKNVLKKRDSIQMEYEQCLDELNRKKNEREHVKITDQNYSFAAFMGKDPTDVKQDKSNRLDTQITKLQKQLEVLNDRTEVANADLKADMDRWNKTKRKDIKELFTSWAEGRMKYYDLCLSSWEDVIKTLQTKKQDEDQLDSPDSNEPASETSDPEILEYPTQDT
ncbi:sorting nexin-7-like isoform X2 [Anneissia japonica]|uniref:sorting nexin-7-like isoform X2 n=1 Tax=Anneissia japonica TaxID=1529436 RepID=UPI0014259945|nr:sorting nexin-7-like isoform X2 [Anneissia japonica]